MLVYMQFTIIKLNKQTNYRKHINLIYQNIDARLWPFRNFVTYEIL